MSYLVYFPFTQKIQYLIDPSGRESEGEKKGTRERRKEREERERGQKVGERLRER